MEYYWGKTNGIMVFLNKAYRNLATCFRWELPFDNLFVLNLKKYWDIYVVAQLVYPCFKFYLLSCLGMVIYDNEFKTKENRIWTTDEI